MTLNSFHYLIFFGIVLLLLWLSGRLIKNNSNYNKTFQWILIVCSYGFVAYADIRFCLCLFFLSLFTYYTGIFINKFSLYKNIVIRIGVIVLLLFLGIFKYYNFFLEQFSRVFKLDYVAAHIILPIGISFYTFSALSYMIDVYRGKYSAIYSFPQLLLYICFFPKLMSGPIVRFQSFFEQLQHPHRITPQNFSIGIQIFVIGMFKKMVLADHLSLFVDNVFYSPSAFHSLTVLWSVISYSLQIYFDFSGYSDMAIGCSKILGFDFDKNFNFPYISKNLTEFWKRWHISLSSWLQEYLYYPLGGNRKGRIRTYFNLLLTMLLGGLWHGAAWTFIAWGFLHGMGLILHKLFMKWKSKTKFLTFWNSRIWQSVSIVLTFIYVSICWIFFRADNLTTALKVIKSMIIFQNGIIQLYTWTIFALLLLCLTTILYKKRRYTPDYDPQINYPLLNLGTIKGLTLFFILCGLTIGMAYVGDTTFIYGAF